MCILSCLYLNVDNRRNLPHYALVFSGAGSDVGMYVVCPVHRPGSLLCLFFFIVQTATVLYRVDGSCSVIQAEVDGVSGW